MKPSFRMWMFAVALVASSVALQAQSTGVLILPEDTLNKLLPASVFLDAQNVPTQARNAVGVRFGNGKMALFTLIDTTGYSSEYQQKYIGVLMTQTTLKIGAESLKPGIYGFGIKKTGPGQTLFFYDVGGNTITSVAEEKFDIKPVKPLQLTKSDNQLRFYLGRQFVAVAEE